MRESGWGSALSDFEDISGLNRKRSDNAKLPIHTNPPLRKLLAQRSPGSSHDQELKCVQKRAGNCNYCFHLALIADKQTRCIGKTHGYLVGSNEGLHTSQSEFGMLNPVSISKAPRHAVFFMGLGSCFQHHLFPGLSGFLGSSLFCGLCLLNRGFRYRFFSTIVMFTITGVAFNAAGLESLHRHNNMCQNHFAFCAIGLYVSSNSNFGH
jgi:hypothetical protein